MKPTKRKSYNKRETRKLNTLRNRKTSNKPCHQMAFSRRKHGRLNRNANKKKEEEHDKAKQAKTRYAKEKSKKN